MILNCDLGEEIGNEEAILPYINAANIACGLHAGSASTMQETVALAKKWGVQVGAHPSWNDRENFGRKEQQVSSTELKALLLYQLGSLDAFCRIANWPMRHVKPHGALYNQASKDAQLARIIAETVYQYNPALELYALYGSELAKVGIRANLTVRQEAFADRHYTSDAQLAPRSFPNALLTETDEVLDQVEQLCIHQRVSTTEKTWLPLKADTICIHGDGPTAIVLAAAIRQFLSNQNTNT